MLCSTTSSGVTSRWRVSLVMGLLCFFWVASAYEQDPPSSAAIISPSHPKDSRGEAVYEVQGKDQKDQPLVPGVLVNPSPISLPQAKYPKSMKRAKSAADVSVLCVVTSQGHTIDATVEDSSDTNASASALDAVRKYRFKPATLDGKPVAALMKVMVAFRVH